MKQTICSILNENSNYSNTFNRCLQKNINNRNLITKVINITESSREINTMPC